MCTGRKFDGTKNHSHHSLFHLRAGSSRPLSPPDQAGFRAMLNMQYKPEDFLSFWTSSSGLLELLVELLRKRICTAQGHDASFTHLTPDAMFCRAVLHIIIPYSTSCRHHFNHIVCTYNAAIYRVQQLLALYSIPNIHLDRPAW